MQVALISKHALIIGQYSGGIFTADKAWTIAASLAAVPQLRQSPMLNPKGT
jgi:hypothetical protein